VVHDLLKRILSNNLILGKLNSKIQNQIWKKDKKVDKMFLD